MSEHRANCVAQLREENGSDVESRLGFRAIAGVFLRSSSTIPKVNLPLLRTISVTRISTLSFITFNANLNSGSGFASLTQLIHRALQGLTTRAVAAMGILHVANELRLLRSTFLASHVPFPQHDEENQGDEFQWDACLQTLVDLIEAGEYFQALASQGVATLLGLGSSGSSFTPRGAESVNREWFGTQKVRIKALVSNQVWVFSLVFW